VLTFDSQIHDSNKRDFNLVKKLLHTMRLLEKSEVLLAFMQRIGRTYTKTLTFLPSKHLLAQIIVCEKLDRYISCRTIESFSKEDLVNRILEGEEYIELEHQTSKLKTVSQQMELNFEEEIGSCLEPHEDRLKQIFSFYASFGEPTKTKYMKSSMIQKMMKDAGLAAGSENKNK